jgi:hypothetical protein
VGVATRWLGLRGGSGGFVAAFFEEFGEPSGGAPTVTAGLDDGHERLGHGVEAGFGDLLRKLLVTFHGGDQGGVVQAELGGGLAEG